ncbi:unnamed protein product [Aphis gossypii]|uniref:DUF7869 domain-containing protein n=1 Tax=Aphis gossypii TaxID=80765 RepID=A0A9P0IRR8_APHGO|nr:unnamed protein product [Aphis gossypii]
MGNELKCVRSVFLSTLDETNRFVSEVLENKNSYLSGVTTTDKRGKHTCAQIAQVKLDDVINHINRFPAYESHYTRRENDKKYLPSHLNMTKMYYLYCENVDGPVSRKIYESEFKKMKLSFKERKTDTCHKCDVLFMKIKVEEDINLKAELQEELNNHHNAADMAYQEKKIDKIMAQNDPTVKCFTLDLQQCLATPDIHTSVAFYKRLYWAYNLTVTDLGSNVSTCYVWHECIAKRRANEIASCLYKELMSSPNTVKTVTLYSDTCAGQNKNSHVASMFTFLLQKKKSIDEIHHKFLIPGHTRMESDSDHSAIEKQKKKNETTIYHPHDWATLIRCTRKKFEVVEMEQIDFIDFANLLKTYLVLRKKEKNLYGMIVSG